ncbi:unnamed protein product [Amoebophrya sp. A25]|nr:unnamed protein product [Amoebophrya sp. A25]|eukprot:GSA25T00002349001.1
MRVLASSRTRGHRRAAALLHKVRPSVACLGSRLEGINAEKLHSVHSQSPTRGCNVLVRTFSFVRAAPDPSTSAPALSITPLEVLALPELRFRGRLVVIASQATERQHEALIRQHFFKPGALVGFDSEAKPALFGRRNRTALIQMATDELCVVWRNPLFVQRNKEKLGCEDSSRSTSSESSSSRPSPSSKSEESEFFFPLLTEILEASSMKKVAQGANGELEQLSREFAIDARNFVCLFEIAHQLQTNPRSLQGLVGIFLRHRLKKDLRCSNWEREALTKAQLDYAACDAYAAHAVLHHLRTRHTGSARLPCSFERVHGATGIGRTVRDVLRERDDGISSLNASLSQTHADVENAPVLASSVSSDEEELEEKKVDAPEVNSSELQEGHPHHSAMLLSGDVLQQLTQLCAKRGLRLRSEGFELGERGRGFVASFSLKGKRYVSREAHASIREAQRDCARLIMNAIWPAPAPRTTNCLSEQEERPVQYVGQDY